jgi:hypothetical protein
MEVITHAKKQERKKLNPKKQSLKKTSRQIYYTKTLKQLSSRYSKK